MQKNESNASPEAITDVASRITSDAINEVNSDKDGMFLPMLFAQIRLLLQHATELRNGIDSTWRSWCQLHEGIGNVGIVSRIRALETMLAELPKLSEKQKDAEDAHDAVVEVTSGLPPRGTKSKTSRWLIKLLPLLPVVVFMVIDFFMLRQMFVLENRTVSEATLIAAVLAPFYDGAPFFAFNTFAQLFNPAKRFQPERRRVIIASVFYGVFMVGLLSVMVMVAKDSLFAALNNPQMRNRMTVIITSCLPFLSSAISGGLGLIGAHDHDESWRMHDATLQAQTDARESYEKAYSEVIAEAQELSTQFNHPEFLKYVKARADGVDIDGGDVLNRLYALAWQAEAAVMVESYRSALKNHHDVTRRAETRMRIDLSPYAHDREEFLDASLPSNVESMYQDLMEPNPEIIKLIEETVNHQQRILGSGEAAEPFAIAAPPTLVLAAESYDE